MKKFYTDYKHYKIELISNHFIYVNFLDRGDGEIDLEITKEMIDIEYKLVKKEPFYQIIDLRNMFLDMSSEAKEHGAKNKEFNELKKGTALLVNTLPNKILVNGHLLFQKPISPTKAFTALADALDWLESIGCPKHDIVLARDYLAKL